VPALQRNNYNCWKDKCLEQAVADKQKLRETVIQLIPVIQEETIQQLAKQFPPE
jgi:hypothetical protein